MNGTSTPYICDGDKEGPKLHPCRRVQDALDEASIGYEKVVAGKGSLLPWKEALRERVIADTGQDNLPALKLADGTVIAPTRETSGWVKQQA